MSWTRCAPRGLNVVIFNGAHMWQFEVWKYVSQADCPIRCVVYGQCRG